jgi:hypothetical protein
MFAAPFWTQIAGSVAKTWGERIFNYALPFWIGGVLAYATAYGWSEIVPLVADLDIQFQLLLAVGGILVVAGSAAVVEGSQVWGLRLLEGYWPDLLAPARHRLIERTRRIWTDKNARWNALQAGSGPTGTQREKLARMEAELAMYPPRAERFLPTRLGNVLRATEDYPWNRYGLATGVVWSRLWLALPEYVQKEIGGARDRLDAAVRLMIWGVLFMLWSVWAWRWVVPVGLLVCIWGHRQALDAAQIYGELVRACFDVHRVRLYEALRWPLPKSPAEEKKIGEQLTLFLHRGSRVSTPRFTVKR